MGAATDWVAVSAGVEHTCGIRSSDLYCWGARAFGRLGDGNETPDAESPVEIDSSHDWAAVACGQYHTCAITLEREVYCWGFGGSGAVGNGNLDGTNTPVFVISGYDAIASGWSHSCAVQSDDRMLMSARCWGAGLEGKLGTGNTDNVSLPTAPVFEPPP